MAYTIIFSTSHTYEMDVLLITFRSGVQVQKGGDQYAGDILSQSPLTIAAIVLLDMQR